MIPVLLAGGCELLTLRDAADHIMKLPKAEQGSRGMANRRGTKPKSQSRALAGGARHHTDRQRKARLEGRADRKYLLWSVNARSCVAAWTALQCGMPNPEPSAPKQACAAGQYATSRPKVPNHRKIGTGCSMERMQVRVSKVIFEA
jgi:hypothetical protein